MIVQVFGRFEAASAGVSGRRGERHMFSHGGIRNLVLNGARGPVGRLPRRRAARREVDVAAKGALVGILLLFERIVVVGQKTFRSGDVDLPLLLGHHLFPANVPGVGAVGHILHIEVGFFLHQLGIGGKI